MDFRNEYRVVMAPAAGKWGAEYRKPRFGFSFSGGFIQEGWHDWQNIHSDFDSEDAAEAACRRHAGEGTKYLGRLP